MEIQLHLVRTLFFVPHPNLLHSPLEHGPEDYLLFEEDNSDKEKTENAPSTITTKMISPTGQLAPSSLAASSREPARGGYFGSLSSYFAWAAP